MVNADHIRAVRNNNPGNVRIGTPWHGLMPREQMSPVQAAEAEFCVFLNAAMGFRAMAEIFHTYAWRDGVTTVAQATHRWAPPNENNTDAYVEAICDYCALLPDSTMPFPNGSEAQKASFLKAFSIHECGGWFFQMSDLYAGVEAAG